MRDVGEHLSKQNTYPGLSMRISARSSSTFYQCQNTTKIVLLSKQVRVIHNDIGA